MGTVANLSVKIGANIKEFADGLKKVGEGVSSVDAMLRQTQIATQGFNAINGAVSSFKALADQASRIQDLADRTGLSAEAVQRLDFAAKQSGTSFETMQNAIRAMANNIVEGNIPKQLIDMGLSAEKLKGMSLDQAFIAIGNAALSIKDPMEQMNVMSEMFGSRVGVQLIAPFRNGMAEIAAQAPLMSNAVVAALDNAGDAWLRTELKIQSLRANALAPLVETFAQLPQWVQTSTIGLTQLLPFIETLTLGVIALGGPGKALAMLSSGLLSMSAFFTTTLPAAIMGMVPFFTTTLPAAFGAVIAFLGPQGLIALAILALAAIWYKWGDDIKAFLAPWVASVAGFFHTLKNQAVAYSQQLFEGVKAWLVDKFNAVVEAIRQKVGMVTGFFKDMYMKVVGGSFVPDMVRGIGQWFGQLTSNMVNPTASATGAVTSLFQTMADSVSRTIDGLIQKIPGVGGVLSDIFNGMGGISGILGALGIGGGGKSGGGILGGLFGGLLPGESGGTTGGGGVPGTGGMPWGAVFDFAKWGIGALSNKLKGGEEGMLVNPARDAYTAGLRAQYGGSNNFEGLVNALASGGAHGDQALGLISVLQNADTMSAFNAAVAAIDRVIASEGGSSGGGGGTFNVNFAVSAIDGQNVIEFVESDSFTGAFIDALRRNCNGILTASQDLIAAEG
jgi:hypothetical protein